MQKTTTLFLFLFISSVFLAQTQIANAGFENWEGSGSSAEPVSWNSNKSGTGFASSGPQTCFQETSNPHSGNSCVRVETVYFILAVVNGNVTTGVVNAPSTNKSQGYISATGANKIAFTGRPDSLVGWYKYTQATSGSGASSEQAKVRAVLHSGNYYDPETPVSSNHPDSSMNKVGDALFVSPASNVTSWKRFSVPFNYVNSTTIPAYIMVSITSSNNQLTVAPGASGSGSKLWVDDLEAIYNGPIGVRESEKKSMNVFYQDRNLYIEGVNSSSAQATLTVFDLTGKIVFSNTIETHKSNNIQLPAFLNSGMYLFQITGDDIQKSGKFIIQ